MQSPQKRWNTQWKFHPSQGQKLPLCSLVLLSQASWAMESSVFKKNDRVPLLGMIAYSSIGIYSSSFGESPFLWCSHKGAQTSFIPSQADLSSFSQNELYSSTYIPFLSAHESVHSEARNTHKPDGLFSTVPFCPLMLLKPKSSPCKDCKQRWSKENQAGVKTSECGHSVTQRLGSPV